MTCAIIPLGDFDCCFCGKDVSYMDGDKDDIKKKIIEVINGIDREDMLIYLNRLIENIVKAGN